MADFAKAHRISMSIEGGYSNDPNDAGGETWHGISRRYHPDWPGWPIIDAEKQRGLGNLQSRLELNIPLGKLENEFYRVEFWDKIRGDQIQDQAVADEIFDTSINMGIYQAVTFLQTALNCLNRNQKNYGDISEDGDLGANTLTALGNHLAAEKGDHAVLMKLMNLLQGMHYVQYTRKHPDQEHFLRGWLKRA